MSNVVIKAKVDKQEIDCKQSATLTGIPDPFFNLIYKLPPIIDREFYCQNYTVE